MKHVTAFAANACAGAIATILCSCAVHAPDGSGADRPPRTQESAPGAHDAHAEHARNAAVVSTPSRADTAPAHLPGLHNVVAYAGDVYSGAAPEGDVGFATLAQMGVTTIISVDGAVPEVDRARARGIRYIHLPIGYNGFDDQRRAEIARAVRDAKQVGGVYIHCHHGKHRSAGAAATAMVNLGLLGNDDAVERMNVSGTSPAYPGLFACVLEAEPMSEQAIDLVPANYPEVAAPGSFVQGMVEIDIAFEHLKEIAKAGWNVPANHPDLVPAALAGMLADTFRHLVDADSRHADELAFAAMMDAAHADAQRLEAMLVAGRSSAELDARFALVTASCADCHVAYRNR